MPYATFDDHFPDHPKVAPLSDAAFRLHVAGIAYCARHLTDGHIPNDEIPRLVRRYRRSALAELTAGERPMWIPREDHHTVHDYLDWNLSREQVLARRETASLAAQKRWGLRPGPAPGRGRP